jgi:hypothetical protein
VVVVVEEVVEVVVVVVAVVVVVEEVVEVVVVEVAVVVVELAHSILAGMLVHKPQGNHLHKLLEIFCKFLNKENFVVTIFRKT